MDIDDSKCNQCGGSAWDEVEATVFRDKGEKWLLVEYQCKQCGAKEKLYSLTDTG